MKTNTEKSVKEKKLAEFDKQFPIQIKDGYWRSQSHRKQIMWFISDMADEYDSLLSQAKRETALQIVCDLSEMIKNPGNSEVGTLMAIQWGIMKGWGIEPEDINKYLKSHLINKKDTKEKVQGDL